MDITYAMGYVYRLGGTVYKMGHSDNGTALLKNNAVFIECRAARLAQIADQWYILCLDYDSLNRLNVYSIDGQLLTSHKFTFALHGYAASYGLLVV